MKEEKPWAVFVNDYGVADFRVYMINEETNPCFYLRDHQNQQDPFMTCYKRNVKRFSSSSEAIDFVFSKYEKPPLSKEQFTERIWLKFPDEIKRDQIRDICTMLNKNISKRVPECAKQILSNDDLSNLFLEFLALKRGKSKDFYKY